MEDENQYSFWQNLWETGFSRHWIEKERNKNLWEYLDKLGSKEEGIFLVPCCGTALDLNLLYQKGYKVLGVEFYRSSVEKFFQDNELDFVTKTISTGDGVEYSTPDGGLRILNCDLFKLTPEVVGGPVSAVWDRGALGSVDKKLRKSYVQTITPLLHSGTRYLLDVNYYNDWYIDSPPRSFPRELIRELLEPEFEVELLLEENRPGLEFLQVPVYKHIFLMIKK